MSGKAIKSVRPSPSAGRSAKNSPEQYPIPPSSVISITPLRHVPEELLCRLWHERRFRLPLSTIDGRPLEIIYPGRWSAGLGPDFQGALLSIDGGPLLEGDVEIHSQPADWFNHGHHDDPRYKNVILHVVLDEGNARDVPGADGHPLPLLILRNYLTAPLPVLLASPPVNPLPALMDQPCLAVNRAMTIPQLLTIMEEAGDARFAVRAARFESAFTVQNPPQALYMGLCDALGYSQNRTPFGTLADILPLERLCALTCRQDEATRQEIFQAVLSGASGLLPGQISSPSSRGQNSPELDYEATEEATALLTTWRLYARTLSIKPLPSDSWQFARLRPLNYPHRRLVALATLLARFKLDDAEGLIITCISLLKEDPTANSLRAAFTILPSPQSFWASRFHFGPGRLKGSPALIGADRAGEIVVNVILPFLSAYAAFYDDPLLTAAVRHAYENMPPLAPNEVIRRLTLQLLGSAPSPQEKRQLVATARRQQGMLDIYQNLCKHIRCYECPVLKNLRG